MKASEGVVKAVQLDEVRVGALEIGVRAPDGHEVRGGGGNRGKTNQKKKPNLKKHIRAAPSTSRFPATVKVEVDLHDKLPTARSAHIQAAVPERSVTAKF